VVIPLGNRFYCFQLKKEISTDEHISNYRKLLADLANMEEMIKDKEKILILLSSIPNEEYKTFVLTLINGKQFISYNEVSATLMNHDLRKKNKQSSLSTSVEVVAVKRIGFNHRKGKKNIGKTDNHQLGKNQYAFCKEEGQWKLIVQGSRIKSQNLRLMSHR